jgi:hypothetical protein
MLYRGIILTTEDTEFTEGIERENRKTRFPLRVLCGLCG